jgi:hypothetical protein
VAEEFIARNQTGWRNGKQRQEWRAGELPVSAVDAGLVVQVLDPIWSAKPETAGRVRGRIEAVLDAVTVRGLRHGPNPAQ